MTEQENINKNLVDIIEDDFIYYELNLGNDNIDGEDNILKIKLYRLIAKENIDRYGIKKGDLGGYVETPNVFVGDSFALSGSKVLAGCSIINSLIGEYCMIFESPYISNSFIGRYSIVYGNTIISNSKVLLNCEISGNANILTSTVDRCNIGGVTTVNDSRLNNLTINQGSFIQDELNGNKDFIQIFLNGIDNITLFKSGKFTINNFIGYYNQLIGFWEGNNEIEITDPVLLDALDSFKQFKPFFDQYLNKN